MPIRSTRPTLRPDLEYPFPTPAMGEFVEVAPRVLWLRLPLPMALDHINVWLLDDGDGWTLVDTGLDVPLVRDTWLRLVERELLGRSIHRIVVTHHHPDHIGLADWLHRETGAPVWMSAAERAACERWTRAPDASERDRLAAFFTGHGAEDVDDLFGPDSIGGYAKVISGVPEVAGFLGHDDRLHAAGTDWRVIVCGGHAPGHLVLWSEEQNVLITGDQVLPRISSNVSVLSDAGPPDPLADFLASLDALKACGAPTVLPAHGKVFRGLRQRLESLELHHQQVLERVTACLARQPASAAELRRELFPLASSGLNHMLAFGESLAHLIYLERRGRARRIPGDPIRFQAAAAMP